MAPYCVPLSLVGRAVKRVSVKKFIAFYESAVKPAGKRASKTSTRKEVAAGKPTRASTGKRTAKTAASRR